MTVWNVHLTAHICDFCADPEPKWTYACEDFTIHGFTSVGAWDACETCHQLIDNNERAAVLHRGLKGFNLTTSDDILKAVLMQDAFYKHRSDYPPIPAVESLEPSAEIWIRE